MPEIIWININNSRFNNNNNTTKTISNTRICSIQFHRLIKTTLITIICLADFSSSSNNLNNQSKMSHPPTILIDLSTMTFRTALTAQCTALFIHIISICRQLACPVTIRPRHHRCHLKCRHQPEIHQWCNSAITYRHIINTTCTDITWIIWIISSKCSRNTWTLTSWTMVI